MRITKVYVTKLFGIFNHPVSLNMEDRITIIHGLNGVGKTTLLRLINGFFNSQYSELLRIHFEQFILEFDSGIYLQIIKHISKPITRVILKVGNHENDVKLTFHLYNHDSYSETSSLYLSVNSDGDFINSPINRWEINSRMSTGFGTNFLLEDVRHRLDILREGHLKITQMEPKWLSDLKSSIDVRFIESQRLLQFSDSPQGFVGSEPPSMTLAVDTYSQEMAKNIQAKLAEYAVFSQSLDRTFPSRVVSDKLPSDLTEEILRNKFNEVEEQRARFIKTGLLDKDENAAFQFQHNIDEITKSILYFYLKDVDKKNTFLDDFVTKIELFQRIIKQRFLYKTLRIDKDKGFIFTTPDGKPLSPTDLSSGEQHELVMLYELLFKVKPNSLILIDEPEISLHLAWQVQFLKDLQAIIKLADFDVLIATHAPGIIDDRWDLTVELKGAVA